MNERIEELFGQALDQAVPETWTTLDSTQLAKLKAKFAELIVRECGVIAYKTYCQTPGALGIQYKQAIEEHFGVEQ